MAAGKKRKPEDENQEVLVPAVAAGDSLLQAQEAVERADELSKETLLPVTGMVRLSPRELDVIDHPAFQRLFEIYQLGQANLVYRGATHMRGEHAIGCISAAMLMVEAIERGAAKQPPEPSDRWQRACALSDAEVAFVRLGVLLHDIGHLPAGHTLEDELGLLSAHDGNERIDMVLQRTEWHGRSYPSLRELIDGLYGDEAAVAGQKDTGGSMLSASQLLTRLVSRDHKDAPSTGGTEFRVGVCRDIIGNTICADLIDYLHRDWMHIGKPRYFDPRLLDYMGILTRTQQGTKEDRLVIRLGSRDRPRPDAITAILDLLESRYQLSEIVLFHRAKLAATGMLERAIAEYRDTHKTEEAQRSALEELVPDLLECSDAEVMKLLEGKLVERKTTRNGKRVNAAVDLLRRLRVRKLHREFHAVYASDLPPGSVAQIAARYSGDPEAEGEARQAATQQAAQNRLLAVRALEYELDLAPGTIVMYCPPLAMNSKIAEVGVYSGGLVGSLAAVDQSHRLTDGYLKAQQERFQRLWRISFAIERSEYQRLKEQDLLGLLRSLIAQTTLWVEGDLEESPEDDVRHIAETLINHENSPWSGHALIPVGNNREQENVDHPGGAPSARSFISPKPSSS